MRRINLTQSRGSDIHSHVRVHRKGEEGGCSLRGIDFHVEIPPPCRAHYGFYVAQSICSRRAKATLQSIRRLSLSPETPSFSLSSSSDLQRSILALARRFNRTYRVLISNDNATRGKLRIGSSVSSLRHRRNDTRFITVPRVRKTRFLLFCSRSERKETVTKTRKFGRI